MIRGLTARAVLAAGLLTGCAFGAASSDVPLAIENDTSIPVGLYVDDAWIGTYAPGSRLAVPMPAALRHPTTVELRSPSDAVLLSLTLNEGQHTDAAAGGFGAGESLGLPCGTLTLLVGRLAEGEALAPAASVAPGPCP